MKKPKRNTLTIRHPRVEYTVWAASTRNYVYVRRCRVIMPNGPVTDATNLHNAKNIPQWMTLAMQMLDLSYDPAQLVGEVPGVGRVEQKVSGERKYYISKQEG